MQNSDEFLENICFEIDKEYAAIRRDLLVNHELDIVQMLEHIINQRSMKEAIKEVAKRHAMPESEVSQMYFSGMNHGIKHEENKSPKWH